MTTTLDVSYEDLARAAGLMDDVVTRSPVRLPRADDHAFGFSVLTAAVEMVSSGLTSALATSASDARDAARHLRSSAIAYQSVDETVGRTMHRLQSAGRER